MFGDLFHLLNGCNGKLLQQVKQRKHIALSHPGHRFQLPEVNQFIPYTIPDQAERGVTDFKWNDKAEKPSVIPIYSRLFDLKFSVDILLKELLAHFIALRILYDCPALLKCTTMEGFVSGLFTIEGQIVLGKKRITLEGRQ